MKAYHYGLVILLHLAIACGFYWDGRNANSMMISGDQSNILPVCQKLDHPEWFANDLFVNDIQNVAYYTPTFVESVRFFTQFFDGNYFQGLNLFGFFIHLAYGLVWFAFFFALRKDFWMALLFSLLMRGVVWPPGGELLGISDLWTIIPRTFYGALLPLPYLLYHYLPKWKIPIASLVLGLLLNLHPISGIGGIIVYLGAFWAYLAFFVKPGWWPIFQKLTLSCFWILLGMLPYLIQYFSTVSSAGVDQTLFQAALEMRLQTTFSDPITFIHSWHRPVFYVLLIAYFALYFMDTDPKRRAFKLLGISALLLFVAANGSVYIEQAVNYLLGSNLRLSFQLIRIQKYILVLFQIALFFVAVGFINRYNLLSKLKPVFPLVLLMIGLFSNSAPLSKIPVVGDDLITSLLPNSIMHTPRPYISNRPDRVDMYAYINANLPRDAVFYGHNYLRAATGRSVVLDVKGASMLIEGNQEAFIQWYLDRTRFLALPTKEAKSAFLRQYGVDYIMVDEPWPLEQVQQFGKCYLYRL